MTAAGHSERSLLYAFVTDEDMLANADQIPVWPVRHESDLRALITIVRSFGGAIAPCSRPMPRRLSGKGTVIALGHDVAEEAKLYAHLTLRECVVASNLRDLPRMMPASVVVTTEEMVTEKLLQTLYEELSQTSLLGLIYAPTLRQLRQQVLVRSAAAYLCLNGLASSPQVQRVDVLVGTDIGYAVSQQWQILGNEASAAEIREALSTGAGVLSLVSHSDGVNSPLSNGSVLCAVDGAPPEAPVSGAPACVVTGTCYRRREPISIALASGALVSPSVIQARILVADICWGLLPPLDVIHPAWGLGRRFLENPSIGAFITCWEIIRTSPHLIAPIADAIANGKPVGESLSEQLSSARWKKFGRRMCLIGDPRVSVPKPLSPLTLASVLRPLLQKERAAKAGAVEFLRAYITLARRNVGGTYEDRSETVLTALSAYQEALWTGASIESAPDAPGPRLREAFMSFVLGRFSVAYPIWQQFADDWVVLEPRRCYGCQRWAVVTEFRLCILGASARRVTNCQSCGTIEDVPAETDVTFSVSADGEVNLRGKLPDGHCAGGLMLETSMPDQRRIFSWPRDTNGNLSRSFRAPPPWPEGPIRISVFIISEACELISLGRQCRSERLVSETLSRDANSENTC